MMVADMPRAKSAFDTTPVHAKTESPLTCPAQEPVHSDALLRGQKSVAIEHQGVIYRLQVTKLGKLILTK
jgi:hemin uptake protein HemP